MALKEIADALVEGCRTQKENENLGKLYHPDAVSVEAAAASSAGPRGIRADPPAAAACRPPAER